MTTFRYHVAVGDESWTFLSRDPLPDYVTVQQIRKLATIATRRFSHWWVWGGALCGVSMDLDHACAALKRVRVGRPSEVARRWQDGAIGRIAREFVAAPVQALQAAQAAGTAALAAGASIPQAVLAAQNAATMAASPAIDDVSEPRLPAEGMDLSDA
jgi:hypothetical protein